MYVLVKGNVTVLGFADPKDVVMSVLMTAGIASKYTLGVHVGLTLEAVSADLNRKSKGTIYDTHTFTTFMAIMILL